LAGVVTQRGNMVEDVSGPESVSTQQFASALRQALADDTVSQILIDIDNPGGRVYGVAELADADLCRQVQGGGESLRTAGFGGPRVHAVACG
jgi:hypothetical protein